MSSLWRRPDENVPSYSLIREAEFRTGVAAALIAAADGDKVAPQIRAHLRLVGGWLASDMPTGNEDQDYQLMQHFLDSWEGW